jgi:hypothetical protein
MKATENYENNFLWLFKLYSNQEVHKGLIGIQGGNGFFYSIFIHTDSFSYCAI